MSAMLPSSLVPDDDGQLPAGHLLVRLTNEDDRRVVRLAGELDAATGDQLVVAATEGHHPAMVIDLADVTFMDCSGYGALEACRLIVELDGRSLATRGQSGQPAHLFELIAALEERGGPGGASAPTGAPPGLRW